MRRFSLFRSNLIPLEYYHNYKELEIFETKCHDYYMLFPLWLLRNDYFDEVIIWRLTNKPKEDIVFDVNGKKYIQRWVTNFNETFDYPSPDISYFRGGFKEYDQVTKIKPKHFGLKLYLGAGRRQFSQFGGKYDVYLMEDERDFNDKFKCISFYKTASPHIFYSNNLKTKYDICWPCNFTQIKYKGQKLFISEIAKSDYLKSLRIVHCGNKSEIGIEIAKKYNVTNIKFAGSVDRPTLNKYLNESSFGLNLSNIQDGCPRVSTEVLMSETPLILKEETRLLDFYKHHGVVMVNEKNLEEKIEEATKEKRELKRQVQWAIKHTISFDEINKKNINLWKKI